MGKNDVYKSQEDFDEVLDIVKRGDIVGVSGKIGRTKTGQLSILTHDIKLLSPCLHVLPKPSKNN